MANSLKISNISTTVNSNPIELTNTDENKKEIQSASIVQKTIEDSVEIISQTMEEEKASNKKAIVVGSSVVFLSCLVAVLNPKNSKRIMSKLNLWQNNITAKLEKHKSKDNFSGKVHRALAKSIDWTMSTLQFSNNVNSLKDIWFKHLCTEKKEFLKIRNKKKRKILQKCDSGFRKVMSKPHKLITKWFDQIGKATIKNKYKSVSKKMDTLELILGKYKDKLSSEEKVIFEAKIAEIKNLRKNYSEENILKRLSEQENLMGDIEKDFMYRFRQYKNGFGNKWIDKGTHVSKNMTFWAEEILMPVRNKLEAQGIERVNKLITNQTDNKGLYDELFEIVGKHLDGKDLESAKKLMEKTNEKLRSANYSECVEYFDKKRDLILGSAPTDIVTAIGGLGLSGVLIATADTKEEKISNALTGAFPVVAGLGASMAFTAMLYSCVKGMAYGALTSVGLSKIGSLIDRKILGNKPKSEENKINNISDKQIKEKINA